MTLEEKADMIDGASPLVHLSIAKEKVKDSTMSQFNCAWDLLNHASMMSISVWLTAHLAQTPRTLKHCFSKRISNQL